MPAIAQRQATYRKLAAWGLSAALLAALFVWVEWRSVIAALRRAEPAWLGAAAGLFALTVFFRGLRFALLLQRFAKCRVGAAGGLDLASISGLFNQLLPLRLGELAFVFLSTFSHRAPADRGLLVLLAARLYDVLAMLLLAAFGLLWWPRLAASGWAYVVGAACMILGVVALRLDIAIRLGQSAIGWLLGATPLRDKALGRKLLAFCARLAEGSAAFRQPRSVAINLSFALGIWMTLEASFFAAIRAFVPDIQLADVMVGAVGAGLASLLPVNAAGSLGTLEAGWTLGFAALGVARADALASAIAMHVVVLGVYALLAGLAAWRLGRATWEEFNAWRRGDRPEPIATAGVRGASEVR